MNQTIHDVSVATRFLDDFLRSVKGEQAKVGQPRPNDEVGCAVASVVTWTKGTRLTRDTVSALNDDALERTRERFGLERESTKGPGDARTPASPFCASKKRI